MGRTGFLFSADRPDLVPRMAANDAQPRADVRKRCAYQRHRLGGIRCVFLFYDDSDSGNIRGCILKEGKACIANIAEKR